jgi:hypothetical protein
MGSTQKSKNTAGIKTSPANPAIYNIQLAMGLHGNEQIKITEITGIWSA